MARRKNSDWYVGSITNWTERDLQLNLDFLGSGEFMADIYSDASDADQHPDHLILQTQKVTRTTVLQVHLAAGGGQAIRLHRIE